MSKPDPDTHQPGTGHGGHVAMADPGELRLGIHSSEAPTTRHHPRPGRVLPVVEGSAGRVFLLSGLKNHPPRMQHAALTTYETYKVVSNLNLPTEREHDIEEF